ncbi:tRNA(Met) cytidine acetyltransferase TmcA [Marinobacter bohaiensis]|uniref:tRNA(Met) cytidine acetyltransferase TmcA n=1 Tax=Marinobacter bohaiensis TaxID=2201898 RepID=UPI001D177B9C|nr:GNAT family N-acetyltransferase [Marinobacter bohaiensis]
MATPSLPTGWPQPDDIQRWCGLLRHAGERRLLLIESDPDTARAYARHLCGHLPASRRLWVGDPAAAADDVLPVTGALKASRWLGRELDLVIWDGWHGNPPDSLAALMGTLGAGALFIWLMPPRADWPQFADPDYARTGLDRPGDHPFLARLAQTLANHPAVVRLDADGQWGSLSVRPRREAFALADSADQIAAIDAIDQTGRGRRRRPLVVRADRGRGKSTALGRAAARLLQDKWQRVLVTAPQAEAVETLMTAAAESWPEAERSGLALSDGERELRFVPPDVLLRERPEAGLVLVDEAAGLPAPMLEAILTGWPRVVFATTVHGYEGTGRGFDVRFRAALDRHTPQWRPCRLNQPIRWAEGDPFEALVNDLFLLDADSVAATPADAEVGIYPWQPSEADAVTLAQAFGLLTDAHYRTTPADLRQWLDDTGARSWLAREGGDDGPVVGVLWASREGGLPPELARRVMRGERRIRGHLLAQSLASHGGIAAVASLQIDRVVRIAVVPELRRRGIGRRLLSAATQNAQREGSDLLGTSFGVTGPLLGFWRRAGMHPLRLGLHRSASSGEHTLQMSLALTQEGAVLQQTLQQRFSEHWPLLLAREFTELEATLALSLSGSWLHTDALGAMDHVELAAFADGYRLFELSRLPLQRLTGQPGVVRTLLDHDDGALWCRAILQGWGWADLQAAGLCQGRRDGEQTLRRLARQLLDQVDTPAG